MFAIHMLSAFNELNPLTGVIFTDLLSRLNVVLVRHCTGDGKISTIHNSILVLELELIYKK